MYQGPAKSNNFQRSSESVRPLERFNANQQPEALLITCSDESIESQLMGTLRPEPVLVWRNSAHVVPPFGSSYMEVEEMIDKAVNQMGVREIIICGHLPCETMQKLLQQDANGSADLDPHCVHCTNLTRQIVKEKYGQLNHEELLQAMAEENIFIQLANLRTYPAVMRGLARGDVNLCSWIFDGHKSKIYSHEPISSRFLRRIKSRGKPNQAPPACLDPCDIYLA